MAEAGAAPAGGLARARVVNMNAHRGELLEEFEVTEGPFEGERLRDRAHEAPARLLALEMRAGADGIIEERGPGRLEVPRSLCRDHQPMASSPACQGSTSTAPSCFRSGPR